MKRIFLFLVFTIPCLAEINSNGDFQIWNRNYLLNHINPQWSIRTVTEFRWGDNASKFYYTYLQSQFAYHPVHWINLAAGYRQIWRRHPVNSNHWRPEYSPLADITFDFRFAEWEIMNRNRLQYMLIKDDPHHWLYRNRFRLIFPWHPTSHKITFFADEEVFIRQGIGVEENRVSGGSFFSIHGNLAGQLFYTYRLLRGIPSWTYQNVLNISLLLSY